MNNYHRAICLFFLLLIPLISVANEITKNIDINPHMRLFCQPGEFYEDEHGRQLGPVPSDDYEQFELWAFADGQTAEQAAVVIVNENACVFDLEVIEGSTHYFAKTLSRRYGSYSDAPDEITTVHGIRSIRKHSPASPLTSND